MTAGRISSSLPFIKKNAVQALTKEYKTTPDAIKGISSSLMAAYKDNKDQNLVREAIIEVQRIYSQNFFPEMKVNWRTYPNNLGHTIFPGCYRCHDGQHTSSDGRTISHDCNACHTIIAEGSGEKPTTISPEGLEFQHPVDIGDVWKEINCSECHTGSLTE